MLLIGIMATMAVRSCRDNRFGSPSQRRIQLSYYNDADDEFVDEDFDLSDEMGDIETGQPEEDKDVVTY